MKRRSWVSNLGTRICVFRAAKRRVRPHETSAARIRALLMVAPPCPNGLWLLFCSAQKIKNAIFLEFWSHFCLRWSFGPTSELKWKGVVLGVVFRPTRKIPECDAIWICLPFVQAFIYPPLSILEPICPKSWNNRWIPLASRFDNILTVSRFGFKLKKKWTI